jgi:hypothetical protein
MLHHQHRIHLALTPIINLAAFKESSLTDGITIASDVVAAHARPMLLHYVCHTQSDSFEQHT